MPQEEVTRLQEQIKTLFTNDARLETAINGCNDRIEISIKELTQKLDQFANRLPTWATALIALLMGVIGWLGH